MGCSRHQLLGVDEASLFGGFVRGFDERCVRKVAFGRSKVGAFATNYPAKVIYLNGCCRGP